MIVNVSDASIIATQRDPTVWLAVSAVVDPATGVVAGLYPRAGRAIDERVEKLWFGDDDLDDFAVKAFGEVRQVCLL